MKNIAISLALALFLAACSSGSSVSDIPPLDISGLYTGEFESSNGLDEGVVTLNIQEDNTGTIGGNLILEFDRNDPSCIVNGVIAGSRSGFNVQLATGQISFALTASADGSVLSGTYVPIGEGCSNASGAGTLTVTR